MRTFLLLSVVFGFCGHAQEDSLVGQWQRVAYYVHECATDKLIRTETEQMALEEEFRPDGTWAVLGSPWKGTWRRLNNNAYRFVYAPHSRVDRCRVEFQGDELRLYAKTCDSLQTNDKKLYGYLLLRKMNKTHYQ